jgi:hypothetical protein
MTAQPQHNLVIVCMPVNQKDLLIHLVPNLKLHFTSRYHPKNLESDGMTIETWTDQATVQAKFTIGCQGRPNLVLAFDSGTALQKEILNIPTARAYHLQRFRISETANLKIAAIPFYRVFHIRCSTARHERGYAACPRREQGKATLRGLATVKTR